MKRLLYFFLLTIFFFLDCSLPEDKLRELKVALKEITEVPWEFEELRGLWYEGGHREDIMNFIQKENFTDSDLKEILDLLDKEEKLFEDKIKLVVNSVNYAIEKEFTTHLHNVMDKETLKKQIESHLLDPQKWIDEERKRHNNIKEIINSYLKKQ